MSATRLLLLAGFASIAAGCQPETDAPAQAPTAVPRIHEAALTTVGTWTNNASAQIAHSDHSATLMRGTGDVLVTGGARVEVYNPYTNSWRFTASPGTARYSHTASELPSGKVLVAGGSNGPLKSSAELYDPATETWSPTGSMSTPRASHSAVVLDSGKVLVVGGTTPVGGTGPQGEVYDPETGTWSAVSGSFTPRRETAATLLYSGKVLVAGGYLWWSSSPSDSSEANLYDPATNSWEPAGNMSMPRRGHFAIRLYSGNVMIVGGFPVDNSVEMYDPYNNRWFAAPSVPLGSMPIFSATLLYSGEVLVTNANGQAALYNPSTNSWLAVASMNLSPRYSYTATLLHTGQVLVVGGNEGTRYTLAVERFTR